MPNTYMLLRPAKTEEVPVSSQVGLLSSFLSIGKRKLVDYMLLKDPKVLSLEIASIRQKTCFYMHAPENLSGYFASQILSQYPKTLIVDEKTDPLLSVVKGNVVAVGVLNLSYTHEYPIKTYTQFQSLPPLSSILAFFSKLGPTEQAFFQIIIKTPHDQNSKQKKIRSRMKVMGTEGKEESNPYNSLITQKLSTPLLDAQIRIIIASKSRDAAVSKLAEFAGIFGIYTLSEGNSFVYKHVKGLMKKPLFQKIARREFFIFQKTLLLNLEELSSLWHLPDKSLEKIKSIYWGKTYISEAPDNLPVAVHEEKVSPQDDNGEGDEQKIENATTKPDINFFARTEWRNREEVFGIAHEDRRKHMYVIGKTGAGKSTLIANMAINDIRNGHGVAVIDPHGDLSEMILNYIPKRRVNDVIYLDPTLDENRSFSLNLFDQEGMQHTDVVASGIVSVFYKLYQNSWGPRLEYMLRNTILSLLMYEDATFADIPRMLTNKQYRSKVVADISKKDTILSQFWIDEFEKMSDRLRTEAISPILNKVGQFLSSQRIRSIVDSKRSTFSLDDVMNEGKILILNLSQGKLGEDTTALLGAMFITKIQLTAMRRVFIPEEERRDFYLYVDEFQNFATNSFIKILSEARKYKLNLTLANQYVGQVDEDIQKAIFGNVGTLVTFVVGARDASLFEKEFGGKFTADDLVALGKFQTLLKMSIGGLTSDPFLATTLGLPSVINNNKEKIIRRSLEMYYKKK